MSCIEATAKVYVILDHPPYVHGGHFGHVIWNQTLVSSSYRCPTRSLALFATVVSEVKMFESCGQLRQFRQQRRRLTTEHGYNEMSLCKPNGSGELKYIFVTFIHVKVSF